eukprot:531876_1
MGFLGARPLLGLLFYHFVLLKRTRVESRMDHFELWRNNQSTFHSLNDLEYKEIESNLLNELGGIRNVLAVILEEAKRLTYQQHIGLSTILNRDRQPSHKSFIPQASPQYTHKSNGTRLNISQWNTITDKIREGNIDYIAELVSTSDIDVNNDIDPQWEETLLSKCAMAGQRNIAKLLLNYGAKLNPHPSLKGSDALKHARKNSQYHVEQLLLLEQMGGGEASVDALNDVHKMLQQNGINNYMLNHMGDDFGEALVKYMITVIRKKVSYSDDVLMMAFQHSQTQYEQMKHSPLYQCILSTCKEIISGSNKRDWYWLKTYMVNSHLWYQPNPDTGDEKQNTTDAHQDVRHILLHDLFKLTERESIRQGNKLRAVLLKSATDSCWNELKRMNVPNNNDKPRQDLISHGIQTDHSRTSLLRTVTPSATFNAIRHHDLNDYLGKLMLRSHILNKSFQRDIRSIFHINAITMTNMPVNTITYRPGPVKMPSRCKIKAESDYNTSQFPTSAHVVDTIRCSLVFKDIPSLLSGLKTFINAINDHDQLQSADAQMESSKYSITNILRLKNGFTEFDINQPEYADVKLNVRVQKQIENDVTYAIIGEVQFLVEEMHLFKKKAHKLYGILRNEEKAKNVKLIYNLMANVNKRIFVHGNMGNVHGLCELMTSYDLGVEDLLYVDPKTKRSIVVNMMYLNNLKALQFLYQMDPCLVWQRLQYKSPKGFSPLDTAAKRGHLDVVGFVLQSYKQKLVADQQKLVSCFRNAVQYGKMEVCVYVVEQFKGIGFSALCVDSKTNTSTFHIACQLGHFKIANWILDQCKSKDERLAVVKLQNIDGNTGFDLAKDKCLFNQRRK